MHSPSGFPHSGKFRGSQNCFEKKNCLGCSQIEICMPLSLPRTRREILPSSLMRWSTHTHGPTFTHPHTHSQNRYILMHTHAHVHTHHFTRKQRKTLLHRSSFAASPTERARINLFMPEDYYDLLDLTLIHSQQTVCRTNGVLTLIFSGRDKS